MEPKQRLIYSHSWLAAPGSPQRGRKSCAACSRSWTLLLQCEMLQTCLVPRSSSLSFVLLHAGNCSPHSSLWPGSSALEKFYFFDGGKSQSYIELKIPVVDTCLPESPTRGVVFPVMMPMSFAVSSKAVHIHLGGKGEPVLQTGKRLLLIWNAGETLYSQCIYSPQWPPELFCSLMWPQGNSPKLTQGMWHPKLCWDTPDLNSEGKGDLYP